MGLKCMQSGMNNRQKKDSMLFVIIGYISMSTLAIGLAIGRLI